MNDEQLILFRDRQDPPEVCRRCDRLFGLDYGGLYYVGADRRPVCRRCFEIEAAAAHRAARERAALCANVIDLAAYRERKQVRAPVSPG